MYQAYMTGIFGAVALFFLAAAVGDGPLTPSQLATVAADGADWLGVVVVVALAIGLRSGSRGGPLALERAEVRHVLLAPVDRARAPPGPGAAPASLPTARCPNSANWRLRSRRWPASTKRPSGPASRR